MVVSSSSFVRPRFDPHCVGHRHPSVIVGFTSILMFVAFTSIPGVAAAQGGSSITFSISTSGAITLNTTALHNLTVWNDFPVFLSDTVYYSVAAFLNSLVPGSSTTTPPPLVTSTTPPPTDDGGGGLSWWLILLIAFGSVVGVVAVVLAIYFGVIANTRVGPTQGGWRNMDGGGGDDENGGSGNTAALVYPPPHAYSKVIQVPMFPHQSHHLAQIVTPSAETHVRRWT